MSNFTKSVPTIASRIVPELQDFSQRLTGKRVNIVLKPDNYKSNQETGKLLDALFIEHIIDIFSKKPSNSMIALNYKPDITSPRGIKLMIELMMEIKPQSRQKSLAPEFEAKLRAKGLNDIDIVMGLEERKLAFETAADSAAEFTEGFLLETDWYKRKPEDLPRIDFPSKEQVLSDAFADNTGESWKVTGNNVLAGNFDPKKWKEGDSERIPVKTFKNGLNEWFGRAKYLYQSIVNYFYSYEIKQI